MINNIIGISGQAGSGKDTVADFLVKNQGFVKVAFADPIKRMCKETFNFTEDQLWGVSEERNKPDKRYPRSHTWDQNGICACCGLHQPHLKEVPQCYLTPRYVLQICGTSFGRNCYKDIWVEYTLRIAKRLLSDSSIQYIRTLGLVHNEMLDYKNNYLGVVISDVRFNNEIEIINSNGGKVVRVFRPSAGLKDGARMHASEAEMREIPDEKFDIIISNNKTLDHLEKMVRAMIHSF